MLYNRSSFVLTLRSFCFIDLSDIRYGRYKIPYPYHRSRSVVTLYDEPYEIFTYLKYKYTPWGLYKHDRKRLIFMTTDLMSGQL